MVFNLFLVRLGVVLAPFLAPKLVQNRLKIASRRFLGPFFFPHPLCEVLFFYCKLLFLLLFLLLRSSLLLVLLFLSSRVAACCLLSCGCFLPLVYTRHTHSPHTRLRARSGCHLHRTFCMLSPHTRLRAWSECHLHRTFFT